VRNPPPVRPMPRRRRMTTPLRALIVAAGLAVVALVLLTAHIFAPANSLQITALYVLGSALLAVWASILAWRVPVLSRRTLALFALVWMAGIGAAVWLVFRSLDVGRTTLLALGIQWLAIALSLAVGGLLLRGLLQRRASLLLGRLLSLVSPLAILLLVLLLPSAH